MNLMVLLRKVLIFLSASILLGIVIIFVVLTLEINSWHKKFIGNVRNLIPEKIETEQILADDYEEALPGGWCNGLTFKVSEKSLQNIQKEGLSFFKGQTPDKDWAEWSEYSYPPSIEEAEIPKSCLPEYEKYIESHGHKIKRDTKAYYTYKKHRGYSNISVFPEWGIVVYSSVAN